MLKKSIKEMTYKFQVIQGEFLLTLVIETSKMDIENNIVYILDTETLLKQIDLIENCPILNNVIVL